MERVFIKTMGRFKRGETHDWPWDTWTQFGDPDEFSAPVERAVQAALTEPNAKESRHARKAA